MVKKNIKGNIFKEGDCVVNILMDGPLKMFKVININSFGNLTLINWHKRKIESDETNTYFGIRLNYRLATEKELRTMEIKEIFNKNNS
jgi:hypothetical protein